MKNRFNPHLWASAIFLLAAATACDTSFETAPDPSGPAGTTVFKTITLHANADDKPSTRLTYEEQATGDGSGLETRVGWSAGTDEKFSLFYAGAPADSSCLFVKNEAEALHSATFTGNAPETIPTGTIYAVYPGSRELKANATSVNIDFARQDGSNKHLMVATLDGSTFTNWDDANFSFDTKVPLIKLTVTCPDFANELLTSISIKAAGLYATGAYTLATGEWTTDYPNIRITVDKNIPADSDGNATVYIAVPPTDGATGEITVTAQCGKKTYAGTLTGRTGLAAGRVYRTQSVALQKIDTSRQMTFTVRPTATNKTFTLPFYGYTGDYTLTADWGDGTETTIEPATASNSSLLSHQYRDERPYTITLTSTAAADVAQMPRWQFVNNSSAPLLRSMDSPMLNTGDVDFGNTFIDCINLVSIHEDLFASNPQVTNFNGCFGRCSSLASIPAGLFSANTEAEGFSVCFSGCSSLTEIPAGLFSNNPKVFTFYECFSLCSNITAIPAGLFDTNTEVLSFQGCFSGCSKLTSVPTGLFDNNTKVIRFNSCFGGCVKLASIPAGLFRNNTKVGAFNSCFSGCRELILPDELFSSELNGKTVDFSTCFYYVGSANGIATGKGGTAQAVWDFTNTGNFTKTDCFTGCTKVTNYEEIPAEWGGPKASDKSMKFTIGTTTSNETFTFPFVGTTGSYTLTVDWGDGTETTTIDPGTAYNSSILSHTYAEAKDYTITLVSTASADKAQMPRWYFSGKPSASLLISMDTPMLNTGNIDFSLCFLGCSNLTTIPAGLFDKNTQAENFGSCFFNCSGLESIPEKLFDNNTNAKDFSDCFQNCSSLESIPTGLFAKNTNVTDFSGCFYDCTRLVLPSSLFSNDLNSDGKTVGFSYCFYNVGSHASIADDAGGTAPVLWEHPKTSDFNGANCFTGCTKVTNYEEIPAEWGGPKNTSGIPITDSMKFTILTTTGNKTFTLPFYGTTGSYTLTVDWGDGEAKTTIYPGTAYTDPILSHTYNEAKDYIITLSTTAAADGAQMPRWVFQLQNNSALLLISMNTPMLNTGNTDFTNFFYGCSNLTTIPTGLFEKNTGAIKFDSSFYGCSNLSTLPAGLFANNKDVTTFNCCFMNCTRLVLSPDLFSSELNGKAVHFNRCFKDVGSDSSITDGGTAPALWEYTNPSNFTGMNTCFDGCTKVTNLSSIPPEWGGPPTP